jgi:hypothetical protein
VIEKDTELFLEDLRMRSCGNKCEHTDMVIAVVREQPIALNVTFL